MCVCNVCISVCSELADLPLVRLDFSCNKVTSIPVCYRQLTQLQSIVLDNNPLQSPPAQVTHTVKQQQQQQRSPVAEPNFNVCVCVCVKICIKGKIHIFKYLNLEASKTTPELSDYDRRPLNFSSWLEQTHPCAVVELRLRLLCLSVCVCVCCLSVDELYPGRLYGTLDSGFNSVDSGDKRWSANEVRRSHTHATHQREWRY